MVPQLAQHVQATPARAIVLSLEQAREPAAEPVRIFEASFPPSGEWTRLILEVGGELPPGILERVCVRLEHVRQDRPPGGGGG